MKKKLRKNLILKKKTPLCTSKQKKVAYKTVLEKNFSFSNRIGIHNYVF